MDTYNQILRTVSPDQRRELFAKIIAANEKNLWVIGLVHDPPDYYVVAKKHVQCAEEGFPELDVSESRSRSSGRILL